MSISITELYAKRTLLLFALTVPVTACNVPKVVPVSVTYDVQHQNLPLPPGVNSDPAQFRNQVSVRGIGPSHIRARLGRNCAGCFINVRIAPVGDTREVNPPGDSSPVAPSVGRPVVKIENLDATRADDMYGFRPSSEFEYYVWADTALSQARITLLEVPAVGQPGPVRAFFQKNLQLCLRHPLTPGSDADFKWCAGIHVSTELRVNRAGMFIAPLGALLSRAGEVIVGMPIAAEPPIWLRCTDGCCG